MRWGISGRLGIAFAAVTGLAVAANLLAVHEIAVIRTTRFVPVAVASPPLPATAVAAAAHLPAPSLPSAGLIAAIMQYEAALRSNVVVHNEESDNRLDDAQRNMQREGRSFQSRAAGVVPARQLLKLQKALLGYRARGDEMGRNADLRQEALDEYALRLDALDAHSKGALDHAWKIFGRVIARKCLIDLNAMLGDIRRRFESLPATDDYDHGALDGVAASETAFSVMLQKNARELAQSQGQAWVDQMAADMAELHTLQASLIQLDTQRRMALDALDQDSGGLVALARDMKARDEGTSAPAASLPVSISPLRAMESPLEPASDSTLESTSTSARRSEHAALIGWISAAVVLLMLLISVWTVASIVGPVRRMRSATRRLAGGEAGVQVARGGILELDELAVSFNQMAQQLASAQALTRTYQDQLEAKVMQRTRELQHLAEHDPLTQLPNRRQLFLHLKDAIEQAEVDGAYVGVFFLDLDNFKNINDSMGHAFGDRVLEAIAEQLRITAGPGGFAARLGGDEFTVVFDSAASEEQVRNVGWELVRAFHQPVTIGGRELMISISVGASLYPDHGTDADELLRAADAALFRAKALGRSQLTVFSPELLEAASAKFSTEQGLRHAMERDEFELVFQPEIDAATLTVSVVEALLRWRLADGRLASPEEFLTVAEESGLIMEISDWVLRSAIEAAARWHHGPWPDARVAINLSSRQLLDSRFVDRVMDLLCEHRLPARCIEIELTENVLQTGAATIDVLRCLRSHGIAIALDDFGTGYSSLASLEQLPLTRVKLDRTLIASIHTSARSAAIARAIVGLCHGLGLEVTAEGIEFPEQLALLVDNPGMCLQGYLLARPVPAEKLLAVIDTLPEHVQSLLLSAPVITRPPTEEPARAQHRAVSALPLRRSADRQ
ncbi:MAG TPA: EAL domain-containing protein [Steroidobacteraceae bacterium]